MKPLLNTSSSSSMFFLLISPFISIDIPTSLGADDGRYTSCKSNSFICGNISNLAYPLWGDNRADYCRLPDFQLTCERNNVPNMIIKNIRYRVLDLEWNSQVLRLVRDDYYDTICHKSNYKNSTFDPTTFKYVDETDYVTLLYDCISSPSESNIYAKDCNGGGDKYVVHYGEGILYRVNCTSVIMPMLPDQITTLKQIQDELDDGFGLRWLINKEQYDACTKSGGECGYDKQFLCFCKQGPQNTSCPQPQPHESTASASGMLLLSQSPMFVCSLIWDRHYNK
ncbi:LEAF RUST 10 DISEASE-RESISTANCE LOCUS RECEPTOR-LIKE PROTEIN KINASE-like 2.7 [Prosopis cineraria]|uniref:LEAF RUST 10 DISEASE-RESISTANCE LOCUS RECEPTOR-LIKE PROTEIN KINASE-like 2.7 n=1 Tax=Prosopis cineraria TaxID=364024 RepID=UPI00240F134A|nr:LEAF RUST 10 DISEASE-RESISTANCE LOCUS RECEPTOR-LIKE PROTEIN KINASE-like 2.7 [Prosopis cineraria]